MENRRGTKSVWRKMIQQCYDPYCKDYGSIGAEMVTVCDRWRESFDNFLADMGSKPKDKYFQRISQLGNFEPRNCHWVEKRVKAPEYHWLIGNKKYVSIEDVCDALGVNRFNLVQISGLLGIKKVQEIKPKPKPKLKLKPKPKQKKKSHTKYYWIIDGKRYDSILEISQAMNMSEHKVHINLRSMKAKRRKG